MRVLLSAILVGPLLLLLDLPASAGAPQHATAALTASGCNLTDAVSWQHIPPVYRIDSTFSQDGQPHPGASIISIPQLGQKALSSPQIVETFELSASASPHGFDAVFVLRDRHRREVASATTPTVIVDCTFA
jgi:hypothetical protein